MSFNKNKAMRNAERYLTQGKIQAAISEYKQVVENDPKDFNSRNMLGDLYTKASDTQAAVNCYQEVAEHYNSQGFAKKAIAIYNKIYRIDSSSIEIASKLAELYHMRGSTAEARNHYQEIAKRYEQKGHKSKALAIWEKIAQIAPNDTDIYLKIADSYWQNDRREDAAKAFIEAGNRFAELEKYESAVTSYSRSLEVDPEDFVALNGFVNAQISLGFPEEGAAALEKILEKHQYNKEINYLLIDCYFEMEDIKKAEAIVLKIVEREPANYPKLLDLVSIYLEKDDLDSSIRILSMASEHMLVGGESEELLGLLNEVLARNPEHIAALRLLARYFGWQKDELELQQTLERLAESAYLNGAIEDERYALSQFLLLAPHDTNRSMRLKEINAEYGFDELVGEQLLNTVSKEIPTFESFATLNQDEDPTAESGFELLDEKDVIIDEPSVEQSSSANDQQIESIPVEEQIEAQIVVDDNTEPDSNAIGVVGQAIVEGPKNTKNADADLSPSEEIRIDEEIESINFYIDQGYTGLAQKSLTELENEFGNRSEIVELRDRLPKDNSRENGVSANSTAVESAMVDNLENYNQMQNQQGELNKDEIVHEQKFEQVQNKTENVENAETPEQVPDAGFVETNETLGDENKAEIEVDSANDDEESSFKEAYDEGVDAETREVQSEENQETTTIAEETPMQESSNFDEVSEAKDHTNSFDDFKDAIGLDESEEVDEQDDFDEHYQHAVVYQEMGMLEEAIREFQDAVNCVDAGDGTSRFLNCCTLLGHCFMEKGMPNLALGWFEKAVENADLNENETLGVYYEIANAHESNKEPEKALEQFEMIYALDVDYRNICERLEKLRAKVLTSA